MEISNFQKKGWEKRVALVMKVVHLAEIYKKVHGPWIFDVIGPKKRGRFLRFSLKESSDSEKNRSGRFSSFSGETLRDTGKMLAYFLVDLDENEYI